MQYKKEGLMTMRFSEEFAEKISFLSDEQIVSIIKKQLQEDIEKNDPIKIKYLRLKEELINDCLSFEHLYIDIDCHWAKDDKLFPLDAYDFLNFAHNHTQDLKEEERVNIISNLKKAIDSQIDWFITYLGFDPNHFNDKKYPYLKKFIQENINSNLSNYKIQFIEALGFDTKDIQKIRMIRNKLEHEYYCPNKKETSTSINKTKRFLLNIKKYIYDEMITTCYIYHEANPDGIHLPSLYLKIEFDPNYLKSKIILYVQKDNKKYRLIIKSDHQKYLFILKFLLTKDFKYLLQITSPNIIPEQWEFDYC